MGLDMYFEARKKDYEFFSYWRKENGEVDKTEYPKDLSALGDYICDINFKSTSIETYYQIGYFRKFNALHNYIVENYADGVDDCKRIFLYKENIKDLLSIFEKINNNHKKAPELLPVCDGFFFGSKDYDEWYFEDIKEGIRFFKLVLEEFDFDKYDLIYQASW